MGKLSDPNELIQTNLILLTQQIRQIISPQQQIISS